MTLSDWAAFVVVVIFAVATIAALAATAYNGGVEPGGDQKPRDG